MHQRRCGSIASATFLHEGKGQPFSAGSFHFNLGLTPVPELVEGAARGYDALRRDAACEPWAQIPNPPARLRKQDPQRCGACDPCKTSRVVPTLFVDVEIAGRTN